MKFRTIPKEIRKYVKRIKYYGSSVLDKKAMFDTFGRPLVLAFVFWVFFLKFYDVLTEWYLKREEVQSFLTSIYTTLENSRWSIFNLTILGVLVWCAYKYAGKVYRSYYLSWNNVAIFSSLLAIFIMSREKWDYAGVIGWIDYGHICIAYCAILTLIELKKICSAVKLTKFSGHGKSYTHDDPLEEESNSLRYEYAKEIASRIDYLETGKSAYSIGITGGWGTGKTTFMNYMKRSLTDKHEIMRFEPWLCENSSDIIPAYFDTLHKTLSSIYHPVSRPLIKYAKSLASMDEGAHSVLIQSVISKLDEQRSVLFENVEVQLSRMGRNLVVFVDDIDRLSGSEILEVLRLIRVTASFKNVVYVVAFDKKHVEEQMIKLGINEPATFLEKFFHVEIPLPKSVDEERWDVLWSELKAMMPRKSALSLINLLSEDDKRNILKDYPSFRRIKRLARHFATDYVFIERLIGEKGLSKVDLFFLIIIQECFPDVYNTLLYDRESLLEQDEHPTRHLQRYIFPEGKDVKGDYYLRRLFPIESSGRKDNNLQMIDSFGNYFCVGVPSDTVSAIEFNDMLKKSISRVARGGMKDTIYDWSNTLNYRRRPDSIYYRFMKYDTKNLDLDKARQFVSAILFWIETDVRESDEYYSIMKKVLTVEKFNPLIVTDLQKYAEQELYKSIEDARTSRINLAKALSTFYDINNTKTNLVKNDVIAKGLLNNFKHVAKTHNGWDAYNLVQSNTDLYKCVYNSTIVWNDGGVDRYHSLICDEVVRMFSERENKSRHKQDVIDHYAPLKSVGPQNETIASLIREKKILFGDRETLYEYYLENCF